MSIETSNQGDIRFIFLGGRESRASAGDITAPKYNTTRTTISSRFDPR
jgi:hypothetical protein